MTELKNRGEQDVLIAAVDGLIGVSEKKTARRAFNSRRNPLK